MTLITQLGGSSMNICHAVTAQPQRIAVATKLKLHCSTFA
jgi:hypothetical protein